MHERRPFARYLPALCLLLLAGSGAAQAADITFTARYVGGTDREFENTTPPSGWCNGLPDYCDGHTTVGLPITYSKVSVAYAPDVRDRFYISMPGNRKVTVTNNRGESHTLDLTFASVSQNMWSYSSSPPPTMAGDLRGGCTALTSSWEDDSGNPGVPRYGYYAWWISQPSNPTPCYSDSPESAPGERFESHIDSFSVGYNLYLPNPNRMRQGFYRGSVTYLIGPGLDIDLGNNVKNLNANSLTVNFELSVEHALDIRFPPGFEHAVLEPPGGWQGWMAGRGLPPKVHRDLPFFLWSTGPFSVFRRCEHRAGDACAIRNAQGRQVPVLVTLSLPRGASTGNAPVERAPIPFGPASPLRIEQSTSLSDERSQLHFEVDRPGVEEMVRDPGSTYQGEVTVVFDADL